MCQPRQFALASALSVACQPVAVKAELPVKSALFAIVTALDLSRAMSRQPRRYFAVQNFVEIAAMAIPSASFRPRVGVFRREFHGAH